MLGAVITAMVFVCINLIALGRLRFGSNVVGTPVDLISVVIQLLCSISNSMGR
jgi:hypothetical protein